MRDSRRRQLDPDERRGYQALARAGSLPPPIDLGDRPPVDHHAGRPPSYPHVMVDVRGGDELSGDAFAIVAAVASALRVAGHADGAVQWTRDADAAESYDVLLRLAMRTVTVT